MVHLTVLLEVVQFFKTELNSSSVQFSFFCPPLLTTSRKNFREENHIFCIVVGQQNEKGENKSIRMPTGRALILESKAYKVRSFHHFVMCYRRKHLLRTFFLITKVSCSFHSPLISLLHCFLPIETTNLKTEVVVKQYVADVYGSVEEKLLIKHE